MILPRLALVAAAPIALAAWLIEPAISYACGGYPCASDQFLPRGGSVPGNISAIAWLPGHDQRDGAGASIASPRFECTAVDGSKHSVRFTALPEDKPDHLRLDEALIPGEHCVISSGVSDCSIDDPEYAPAAASIEQGEVSYLAGQAEFDVVDDSRTPANLGLIAVTGAQLGDVDVAADASCSEHIEVCVVSSSLDFNSEALPWKDALLYETFVDGERFVTSRSVNVPDELGGLYSGRDRDIVFAPLGDVPGNAELGTRLDPGEHTLQIKAHLPGSSETLSTPVVTIVLSCGNGEQPQLAQSVIPGDSGGCTVSGVVGASAQRRPLAGLIGVLGLLLMAARRRRFSR